MLNFTQEITEDYESDGLNEFTAIRAIVNETVVYEDRVNIRSSGAYYFENVRALYEEAQNAIYDAIGSPMHREAGSLEILPPYQTESIYSDAVIYATAPHEGGEGYGIYELLADEGRL